MLITVHSGYVGSWSLYFYIYQATSPIKIWQNNLSQQGARSSQEMGGRGELGWASGSRTQLGVESDNVFIQKVGEEVWADLAVHTEGRGGSWSCLLKAWYLVHLPEEAGSTYSENYGRGDLWVPNPMTYCLWAHPGEGWWLQLPEDLVPSPKTILSAPQEKQGRDMQFQAPWEAYGPPNLLGWRPLQEVIHRGFPLFSFPSLPPPQPAADAPTWSRSSLPPSLSLPWRVALGYPFLSLFTSILLSAKWVAVCKAGWENPYNVVWYASLPQMLHSLG